jgi:hypothetical protein
MCAWLAKIARKIRHVRKSAVFTLAAVLYLWVILVANRPAILPKEKIVGDESRPATVSIGSSLKQQVTFTVPSMLLSSIKPNEHVPIEVPLLNDTEQEVRFTSVQTSCGCAQAILAEDFIPPGGTSKLRLEIRPSLGSRIISCSLTTSNNKPCQLLIDLHFTQRIMFSVADLGLGKQTPNSTIRRRLSLRMVQTIDDAAPWKLESLASDSSQVSSIVHEAGDSTSENGDRVRDYDIDLSIDTGLPAHTYSTALTATAISPSGESVIASLPVSWKTAGIYNVQPASAYFNLRTIATDPNDPPCCTLRIDRSDGTPPKGLEIRSVTGLDNADVKVHLETNHDHAILHVILEHVPALNKLYASGLIEISTADQAQNTLTIPIHLVSPQPLRSKLN